ncbi:hypothetical protein [Vibrio parahaemolyticus]|uniref:hypothetical protein n=1 Tax=Vibrio parahaemolyticus TaxID=670 RepID=UPI00389214FB
MTPNERQQLKNELKKEITAELKTSITEDNSETYESENLTLAGVLVLLVISVPATLVLRFLFLGDFSASTTKNLMVIISSILAISGIGLAVHNKLLFPKLAIFCSLLSAGLAAFANLVN